MPLYEVRTPAIVESMDAARLVIEGLQNGKMETVTAGRIISAARTLQSGVATDIKARLAAPRILAQEAKLLEEEQQAKLNKPEEEQPARRE